MKSKRGLLFVAIFGTLLVSAPVAFAHIERASYWPAPGAEQVDGVSVGGAVPQERPLFTALDTKPVGDTAIVCQGNVPKVPKALNDKKATKKAKKKAKKKYNKAINKNASIKALDKSLKNVVGSTGKKKKGKKGKGKKADAAAAAKKKKKGKKKKGAKGKGYVLRPSEPNVLVTQGRRRQASELQRQAAEEVQVRLDPGGGQRFGQQRPHRHHAGRLHRARLALRPDERPEVRRAARRRTTAAGPARSPTATRCSARTTRT